MWFAIKTTNSCSSVILIPFNNSSALCFHVNVLWHGGETMTAVFVLLPTLAVQHLIITTHNTPTIDPEHGKTIKSLGNIKNNTSPEGNLRWKSFKISSIDERLSNNYVKT